MESGCWTSRFFIILGGRRSRDLLGLAVRLNRLRRNAGFEKKAALFVQASEHAAGIADGEDSGGKVAGDDAACTYDGVLTDGDAGEDNDTAAPNHAPSLITTGKANSSFERRVAASSGWVAV